MPKSLVILLLLFAGVTIAGGIYKWVDEQGRTVYSDKPPPGKAAQHVDTPPQPPNELPNRAQQGLETQRQEQQPKEQPQEVLGSFVLGFAPSVGANSPEPPINSTLIIRSIASGSDFKLEVTDRSMQWKEEKEKVITSDQNFTLSLRPGSYEIVGLDVKAESLSDLPFSLVTGGPRFSVPEGNCVYIGRIAYFYMRLPPGSFAEAKAAVGKMAKDRDKPILFLYLTKGALVNATASIDIPDGAETRPGSTASKRAYTQAREKNCAVHLAKF
jgi:hypothetical protein